MEPLEPSTPTSHTLIDTHFATLERLRPSDALLFKGTLIAVAVFLIATAIALSTRVSVDTPAHGGIFHEGVVGTPRFVNPVLAVTRADKDLTALMYDGLMRLGTDGTLVPNIAESITVSDDGLTYNVILKDNVYFHDGTKLTARDVAFTVMQIEDAALNSPLRASFDGVVVEEVGEREINFVLPAAYSPFLENLTFGILPEHIWKDAGTEEFPFSHYNSEPVGTGPYQIKEIVRNASGIPEEYILAANSGYHGGAPKIETVELHFFPTEERLIAAFKEGVVESVVGVDPASLARFGLSDETHHLERIPLPRTFAIFFNQNKSPALRDPAARKALSAVINRTALVTEVLSGYGNALTSPVPPGFGFATTTADAGGMSVEEARDILREGGWKVNAETGVWEKTIDDSVTPLRFSIATVNNSTFEATAEFLRKAWVELGAEVTVKQFEQPDLTQAVIRPRDYEALLFGTQLGRSLDYYSFWHSSQRNDPGLNIALYANITTDSILSELRRSSDTTARNEGLSKFVSEVANETPAVFLYAPELIYIFPNRVTGAAFQGVAEPHERFSGITTWYTETESIWPLFNK